MHPDAAQLFKRLRSLDLPAHDYAVFGSGPLIIRGIIPPTNDLDILCRGAAWQRAQTLGVVTHLEQHGVDVVNLFDGTIQLGTRWGIGEFDTNLLIDTAELINEIPCVRLEHVIAYKRKAGRPKDLDHLTRIEQFFAN